MRGFKVVHVFDVAQTEGEDLPEFTCAHGDPGRWLTCLETVVSDYGIALEYVEYIPGGARGLSEGKRIRVLRELAPSDTFLVICHELGHELLHKRQRRAETSKQVRETEAEAIAFVVGQAIGLETINHSSDYIQLYQGDTDTLCQSMDAIQTTAAAIIDALQAVDVRPVDNMVKVKEGAIA